MHWLRVLYCYPDTVNEELLTEIRDNPKICKYLDLPLQHIDDELLKRMNRRGTSAQIEQLLSKCRQYGITTRTTMIVGFPGETQAQFEKLLSFVKRARFDRLGAFTYSPEENTPAASMPDQIDEETKTRRLDQLMLLQQAISLEKNEERIGSVCEVLVEGFEDGAYTARSMAESPESDGVIRLTGTKPLTPGQYIKAKITGCDAYDLSAEAVE